MPILIGVAGLCGTGKSTAVEHLALLSAGQTVYLGGLVLEEIKARGLPLTPDSERLVQIEIRAQHGVACLAHLAMPRVTACLQQGTNVIVDAIFALEEFDRLKTCSSGIASLIISIHSPFVERCKRLARRKDRPLTPEQLRARDDNEVKKIGIGAAIALGDYHIVNDGSIENLHARLDRLWTTIVST